MKKKIFVCGILFLFLFSYGSIFGTSQSEPYIEFPVNTDFTFSVHEGDKSIYTLELHYLVHEWEYDNDIKTIDQLYINISMIYYLLIEIEKLEVIDNQYLHLITNTYVNQSVLPNTNVFNDELNVIFWEPLSSSNNYISKDAVEIRTIGTIFPNDITLLDLFYNESLTFENMFNIDDLGTFFYDYPEFLILSHDVIVNETSIISDIVPTSVFLNKTHIFGGNLESDTSVNETTIYNQLNDIQLLDDPNSLLDYSLTNTTIYRVRNISENVTNYLTENNSQYIEFIHYFPIPFSQTDTYRYLMGGIIGFVIGLPFIVISIIQNTKMNKLCKDGKQIACDKMKYYEIRQFTKNNK